MNEEKPKVETTQQWYCEKCGRYSAEPVRGCTMVPSQSATVTINPLPPIAGDTGVRSA